MFLKSTVNHRLVLQTGEAGAVGGEVRAEGCAARVVVVRHDHGAVRPELRQQHVAGGGRAQEARSHQLRHRGQGQ